MATEERIELTAVDKFSAVIGQAQSQFKQLGSTLDTVKGAMAAVGVTVGAGAMVALYHDVIKATGALDDMAEATGSSVENLSKIQQVAKIGGHDFAGLADQMAKTIKGIKSVDEDGQKAVRAFEYMDIKVKDVNGRIRDQSEVLIETAKWLAKYEDGGNKVALVQDALGKGAQRYLPLLKDIAEEGDLVANRTAEQAAQAEKYEKAIGRLNVALEDSRHRAVEPWVKSLTEGFEQMAEGVKIFGSFSSALYNIGFAIDPFKSLAQNMREIRVEMERASNETPYFRAMRGSMLGGPSEETLRKRLDFLKFMERQQALAGAGPGDYDARDLRLRQSKSLNYQSPDSSKAKGKTLDDLLSETAGLDKDFYKDLQTLHAGYTSGRISLERYQLAVTALVEKQKFAKEMDEQRKASLKSLVETQEIAAQQQARQNEILAQANERLSEQAQQLEFEISQIESAESVARRSLATKEEALRLDIELTSAREKAIAFRKIDLELQRQMVDATPETVEAITKLAEAEKARLGLLIDSKVAREKTRDAAGQAAEEWKSAQQGMWRSIDDTAQETFRSILNSGKGTFERLHDALKNGVYDLLYQMTVKKWLVEISTAISGSGGLGGNTSSGGMAGLGGLGRALEGLMSFGRGGLGYGSAGTAAASSFVPDGAGGLVAALADGGVMSSRGLMPLQRYSRGGVADSPQVAVFGEGRQPEAFVPLPDGRRIPVVLDSGDRGQSINVTMHVHGVRDTQGFRESRGQIANNLAMVLARSRRDQ